MSGASHNHRPPLSTDAVVTRRMYRRTGFHLTTRPKYLTVYEYRGSTSTNNWVIRALLSDNSKNLKRSREAHFKEWLSWKRRREVSPVIPDNRTRASRLWPDDWRIWLLLYRQINHRIPLCRVHHFGKTQIDFIFVSSGCVVFCLFSLQLLQLLFRCDKKCRVILCPDGLSVLYTDVPFQTTRHI